MKKMDFRMKQKLSEVFIEQMIWGLIFNYLFQKITAYLKIVPLFILFLYILTSLILYLF